MNVVVAYDAFTDLIRRSFPKDRVSVWDQQEKISRDTDLLVITGGEDISPGIYGKSTTYSRGSNSYRDNVELAAMRYATENKVKMFGICRGLQLGVAFFGGNLYQDIYYETGKGHSYQHELTYLEPGILEYPFKVVNSMHHQGAREIPHGMRVVATYQDIPEIVETPNFIGVQFHPEFMGNAEAKEFFSLLSGWAKEKISPLKNLQPSYRNAPSDISEARRRLENPFRLSRDLTWRTTQLNSNFSTGTFTDNVSPSAPESPAISEDIFTVEPDFDEENN